MFETMEQQSFDRYDDDVELGRRDLYRKFQAP
jgi:hypothetical protein